MAQQCQAVEKEPCFPGPPQVCAAPPLEEPLVPTSLVDTFASVVVEEVFEPEATPVLASCLEEQSTKHVQEQEEEPTPFPESPAESLDNPMPDENETPVAMDLDKIGCPETTLQKASTAKTETPDSASARTRDCLLKARAKRLAYKTAEEVKANEKCSKQDEQKDAPTQTIPDQQDLKKDEPSEDKSTERTCLEHAQSLLPNAPRDLHTTEHVTADQQQPPKPRGRKKKTASKPEEEKKEAPAKETKPRQSRKRKNTENETPAPATKTAEEALEDLPKRKGNGTACSGETAKAKCKSRPAKKMEYSPLKAEDPTGKNDKGAAFDAYAAASIALDMHQINNMEASHPTMPADPPSKKRRATQPSPEEKPKKSNRSEESKARLSRKSCAYKKVHTQKIKEGCSKEDAARAARAVPLLCTGVGSIWSSFLFPCR